MGLFSGKVYPFWGSSHPQLFDLLSRATDPDGLIPAAVAELAPVLGRTWLDIGAGFGKYASWLAAQGAQVVAIEPNAALWRTAQDRLRHEPRVRVVKAGVERLPLPATSVDHACAFWAYFFGSGDVGLRQVDRVLRPGGCLTVVQNAGGDELSQLWSAREAECESWWPWFEHRGFERCIVASQWRFANLDEATALLSFLFPERAAGWLAERGTAALRIGFRAAIYYRFKEESA